MHKLRKEIDIYFKTNLKVKIKDNWQVFPTFVRGLDFVGYRTFLNFKLLRKSTCKHFKKQMVRIRRKVEQGQMMNYSEWCSVNSYRGWLKHCNSHNLYLKYVKPLEPYTRKYYFEVIKKGMKKL